MKMPYNFKTLFWQWFPLPAVVIVLILLLGLFLQFGLFVITALLLPFSGGIAIFLFLFKEMPAGKEDLEFEVFYKKVLAADELSLEAFSSISGIGLGKLERFVDDLLELLVVNFFYDSSTHIIYAEDRRKDIVKCPICGSIISDHGRGKCGSCKSVYSLLLLNGPNNYLLTD